MKKLLICLTVLFSAFLFTNSVIALEAHNINDLNLFSEEITEDYLYETFNVDKEAYPYVIMFASENSMISGRYETYLFFMTENDNLGLRHYESGGIYYCTFSGNFAYYTWTSTNAITKEINLADYSVNYKSGASKGNWRGSLTRNDFYYFSNFDILTITDGASLSNVKITTDVYLPANKIQNFNITLHLNGGVAWDENEICDNIGCYIIGSRSEDYTISVPQDNLISYLANVYITKEPMQFVGWYYDEKLTQKVNSTDTIDSDKHFYAKYQYKNVEDFLNNTTFNSYTFDENYQYAVISLNNQEERDIYLGLNIMSHNLEVYKYDKINLNYEKGSSICLTPIFSKDNKYYYQVSDSLDDTYEVLILEKEKLKGNYNFLLSNNAYVTYTNDLTDLVIKDENGNDIHTNIEDSYNYSQDNLLNSENDLLEIFKELITNKDNNIFSYFNQVWNLMKTNKLFIYFMCLIIGSLIILIIKAASR